MTVALSSALAVVRRHAPNFRPVGEGLLAPGRLYRSGELSRFDRPAWDALDALGIRTLIDLRGPLETEQMPVTPPAGFRLVSIPLQPGDGRRFHDLAGAPSAAALIGDAYRRIVTDHRSEIGRIFRLIADEDALPAVLFCTAGKDRTGIVSALFMAALEFEPAHIQTDYALTNIMLTGEARQHVWDVSTRLSTFSMPAGPIVDAMMAADPAYLDAAFEAIEPLPAYLDTLGLDRARLDKLRAKLLIGR